jgi:uncharacterized membrane protein
MLAYAGSFAYLTLVRYAAFEARALDMGNMDQAIWNTAQGRWFHLTNQPGTVNRLSLHVEPILLPIAALYRIYAGPPTLLLLQATVVALGALPLFGLARRLLGHAWWGLAFGVAFLLNPAIQAANWLEFHPVTLAPTFLLAAFYFMVSGRAGWFALFAILAASCKEEISLLVFMLGLYALLVLRRPRWGLLTMSASLLWAFVAVFLIQNTFAAGNIHWGRYDYLGASPGAMVWSLITRPGLVLAQLSAAGTLRYLYELLFPVAFLPLVAPELFLLALPSLGINLLADFSPMHQVNTLIYAAPIVPFVFISAVYGAARLQARWGTAAGLLAVTLLLASALANQWLYGYLPGGGNYRHYTITAHHRHAATILAQIPQEAKVSAQDKLIPHVSSRETVYIFPRVEDAGTVLVDVTGPAWPQHPNDLRNSVAELLDQAGFGIAAASDGYLLLSRQASAQTPPDSFYSAWQRPDHPARLDIHFGDSLRLVDYVVTTDAQGELIVQLYWQALHPLAEDLRIYVAYADQAGTLLYESQFYPPVAQLWYPTSMWTPGQTTLVQTLPWTLESTSFTLYVGVHAGDEWHTGRRLPARAPDLPLLEDGTLVRLGAFQAQPAGWSHRFSSGQRVAWHAQPVVARAPARTLAVTLDAPLALLGVDGPPAQVQAGDQLEFALTWQATAPVARDYTFFVHLVEPNGTTVAQLDRAPRDQAGPLPTSSWVAGQVVVDPVRLAVPEQAAPGLYRLVAGLYYWEDGARLPVTGVDSMPGDLIVIGTIEVR